MGAIYFFNINRDIVSLIDAYAVNDVRLFLLSLKKTRDIVVI